MALQLGHAARVALLLVVAADLTAAQYTGPKGVGKLISDGPETVKQYWNQSTEPLAPWGYRLTVYRTSPPPPANGPPVYLTGTDGTVLQDYDLAYAAPTESYSGECCYSAYTFNLERGASAQLTLTTLDQNQQPISGPGSDPLVGMYTMSSSAPDPIPSFTSSSDANDGRHRHFSFTAPFDNGEPITYYIVRRSGGSGPTVNYRVNCSETETVACDDYTAACYNMPVSCVKDSAISFTLGVNYPPDSSSYIVPTQTYTWSVIAINTLNEGCYENDGSCNVFYGGFSSPSPPETQPIATPDRPTSVTTGGPVASVSSSSMITLSFMSPNDNGSPLIAYKTECEDVGNYIGALKTAWQQPTITKYTEAGPGSTFRFMHGLSPGTLYRCYVSANNSAGGFDQATGVFQMVYADAATDPEAPDMITGATYCLNNYDNLGGDATYGYVPTTSGPSYRMRVRFTSPRPNDANYIRNPVGVTNYQIDGPLAPLANYSISNNARFKTIIQTTPNGEYYQYGGVQYTFLMKPIPNSVNLQTTPFSNPLTCTSPKFRPASPYVQIVDVLDRSVIINWTSPNDHGSAITQYAYQICTGSSCDVLSVSGSNAEPFQDKRYLCSDGTTSADVSSQGPPSGECSSPAQAGTSFTITLLKKGVDLQPETPYSLIVRAKNDASQCLSSCGSSSCCGLGWASNQVDFTTEAVVSTPTSLFTGKRTLHVSWNAYTDAYSYEATITYTNQTYGEFTYTNVTLTTDVWFTGLTPGLPVSVVVRARKNAADGPITGPSETATFTLDEAEPEPVVLSSSSLSIKKTTGVTISFGTPYDNGKPVTSFKVYVTSASMYAPAISPVTLTLPPTQNGFAADSSSGSSSGDYTYAISGLTPNVEYDLIVTASNTHGEGLSAPPISYTACKSIPFAPGVPAFLNKTTSSIGITWDAPYVTVSGTNLPYDFGAPITGYKIEMKRKDGVGGVLTYTVDSAVREYVSEDVLPGRAYNFRVRADNGVLTGRTSQLCSVSTPQNYGVASSWSGDLYGEFIAPEAPNPPTIKELFGTQLQIEWTPNFDNGAPITAYTVYTNASTVGPRTIYADNFTNGVMPNPAYAVFPQLTPITPYGFTVTAWNAGGESAHSSPLAILTTDKYTPNQLYGNDFVPYPDRTANSITLEWYAPNDNGMVISKYAVKYRCTVFDSASCPNYPQQTASPNCGPSSGPNCGILLVGDLCGSSNPETVACQTKNAQAGLAPSTGYEYSVRSYNAYSNQGSNGWSEWSPWQTFYTKTVTADVPPVPEPPTIYTETINTTSVTIGWRVMLISPTPPISRFQLITTSLSPANAPSPAPFWINEGFLQGEWFNYTLTGLLPYTEYSFTYLAFNVAGPGGTANATSFTTLKSAPGEPGVPSSTAYTDSTITLGFATPRDNGYTIDKYKVALCAMPDPTLLGACLVDPSLTAFEYVEYTVNGQPASANVSITVGTGGGGGGGGSMLAPPGGGFTWEPGTYYKVVIQAHNQDGYGPISEASTVFTATSPDTPTTPTRGPPINGLDGATAIHVVWEKPYSWGLPISNYEIKVDGGSAQLLDGAQEMYIAAGVKPATVHNFTIRAQNLYSWSSWSALATLNSSASAPTLNGLPVYETMANMPSKYTVTLPMPDENGYSVTSYQLRDQNGVTQHTGAGSVIVMDRNCDDPAFLALQWEYRAFNEKGWSEWSAPSKPSNPPVCETGQVTAATPLFGTLTAPSSNQLHATWQPDPSENAGSPPTGYLLMFLEVGSTVGTTIVFNTSSTTSYTWDGATSGTTYTAQVMAVSGAAYSGYTPPSPSVTTPMPATNKPSVPGNVMAGPGMAGFDNTTYVHVVWTAPADLGNLPLLSYQVQVTTTGSGSSPSSPSTITQTIMLNLAPDGTPPYWQGTPESGLPIATVCSDGTGECLQLLPGTSVTIAVSACNTDGCSDYSSPSTMLQTADSVPGQILTKPVAVVDPNTGIPGPNATTIECRIAAPSYTGGLALERIEVSVRSSGSAPTYVFIDNPPQDPSAYPITFYYLDRIVEKDYFLAARAVNSLGPALSWSPTLDLYGITPNQPPAPTDLTIPSSSIVQNTFDITFSMAFLNGSNAINSYRLSLACQPGQACPTNCQSLGCPSIIFAPPQSDCSAGCTHHIDDPSVGANIPYTVQLFSRSANGAESPASLEATVLTMSAKPNTPMPLTATNIGQHGFRLTWPELTLQNGANGDAVNNYALSVSCTSENGDFTWSQGALAASTWCNGGGTCTYDVNGGNIQYTNPQPSSNCSASVIATNTIGDSDAAVLDNIFTLGRPRKATKPRKLLMPGVPTGTIILIDWVPPFDFTSPIDYYDLKIDGKLISPPIDAIGGTGGSSSSGSSSSQGGGGDTCSEALPQYMLFNQVPGSTVTFEVRAHNLYGDGNWSDIAYIETTTDVPGIPPPPTFELEADGENGKIKVTIQAAPYPGIPGAEASLIYQLAAYEGALLIDGVSRNYTAAEMGAGAIDVEQNYAESYKFKTRVFNSLGPSEWSAEVLVASEPSKYPPPPLNLTVVNVTQHEAMLTWRLLKNQMSLNASLYLEAVAAPCGSYCTGTGEPEATQTSFAWIYMAEATSGPSHPCTLEASGVYWDCSYTLGTTASTSLAPFTNFQFKLSANNENGPNGPFCARMQGDTSGLACPSIRTLESAPDAPLSLHVSQASTSSLAFGWEVPYSRGKPILGYILQYHEVGVATGTGAPSHTMLLNASGAPVMSALPPGRRLQSSASASASSTFSCSDLMNALATSTAGSGGSSSALTYGMTVDAPAIGQLPSGAGYVVEVTTCSELGGSTPPACMGPYGATHLPQTCNISAVPRPNTYGVPDPPPPVNTFESQELNELRTHALFLSWGLPYDNESPINQTHLVVGTGPDRMDFYFDTPYLNTSLNITTTQDGASPLPAATQYPATLYAQNDYGWSVASPLTWLTTLPTKPAKPPAPRCDAARTTHDELVIDVEEARPSNGQPVTKYYVTVYELPQAIVNSYSYSGEPTSSVLEQVQNGEQEGVHIIWQSLIDSSVESRTISLKNQTVAQTSGGAYNIKPAQSYLVVAQAENSIGWSLQSDPSCLPHFGSSPCAAPCVTPSIPAPPPPWGLIMSGGGGTIVILLVLLWVLHKLNADKIFAPRTRKKKETDADMLADFVSSDATVNEEHDPELVLNPIFVHKIKQQREAMQKQKSKKKGMGNTGGLARLGFAIETKVETEQDLRIKDITAVDQYLEKVEGTVDRSKGMTAHEKDVAAKELKRAAKKAAGKSALTAEEEKKRAFAAQRDDARRANQAAKGYAKSSEDTMEQGNNAYSEVL